jgi:hypothetical protein
MLGTGGVCGARAVLVEVYDATDGVLLRVCACEASLLTPSGTAVGDGGGNGDMEMLEMEAEWAW